LPKGYISYEDAIRYADAPNDLRLKLKIENIGSQANKPGFDICRLVCHGFFFAE